MSHPHPTETPIYAPPPTNELVNPSKDNERHAYPVPSPGDEKETQPYENNGYVTDVEASRSSQQEEEHKSSRAKDNFNAFRHSKAARVIWDFAWIALLLGWWIPGILRESTRHYWIITTIWTWFFILFILLHNSRYIPQKPFIVAIGTTWETLISKPFFALSYKMRLGFGWLAIAALFLGSAFGIKQSETSPYKWRAVSLCGLLLMYGGVFAFSTNRSAVQARQVIVGLGLQMIMGLFVFKTKAGLDLFRWMALAAADFLEAGISGGATFFWRTLVPDGNFATNTLSSIIWFVSAAVALYYCGVMGWVIKKFAWFFYKLFGISGAEAVVAAASPFIGQGENCILTKPFVKDFTMSEMHQALTSGFATIAGSVFLAYVSMGVDPVNLLTSSLMSIPASIALSKTMVPETEQPVTAGQVTINKGDDEDDSANLLHAFSNGAWLGLRVAGLIFANVLCIVSALYCIDGILAWIGQFWGIARTGSNSLSLEMIVGYIFYPLTFFLGVPPADILPVSRLIALKVIANEFVAYDSLTSQAAADPNFISARAQLIAQYALCGFGNLASGGIQIGILTALAPTRGADIVKTVPRALITGIIATLSTACVAGLLGDR